MKGLNPAFNQPYDLSLCKGPGAVNAAGLLPHALRDSLARRSGMEERIPITKAGLGKVKAELDDLVGVQRPAIQRAIGEAREHGDLRENAEYHAAKERQSFIEGRIQEINARLPRYHVVDPSTQNGDKVMFGAMVTLENLETGEVLAYRIVGPDEADIKESRISYQSPIARALIGREPGDVVTVQIPRGQIEVEITDVSFG